MVLVIAVSTLFILSSHINAQNNNYVGRIEGYFNQTPAGAATYTIPLKLCDGYSSFTPSIESCTASLNWYIPLDTARS